MWDFILCGVRSSRVGIQVHLQTIETIKITHRTKPTHFEACAHIETILVYYI